MITNQFISSNLRLKPFVSNYLLSTSQGVNTTFRSQWAASNEISLLFYLGNRPNHNNNHVDSILTGKRNCFVGPSTRYNGVIDFSGIYRTFIIQFELNGIHKVFGLPMLQFTDKIYSAEDVFGKKAEELHEQLTNAVDIQEMAIHADAFILHFLNNRTKQLLSHDCITLISKACYNTTSSLTVTECARMMNMCVKSLERKFLEQTGIFPKLYMKLLRFNEAIKMKTLHPCKSFTSIAYECGYFDQMHFIKDFKRFTNLNPRCFFTKSKELGRPRIDIRQAPDSTFKELNNKLSNEQFISVMRTT